MSDPSVMQAPPPGSMIGQYRVQGPPMPPAPGSSSGAASGVVLPATDTKLDRPVLLRQASPALAADPAYAEAFLRDCRALVRVGSRCPHAVAVLDYVQDGSGLWCVTEAPSGRTLESLIAADSLSDPQRFQVLVQALLGLSELHAAGILHRDVRPASVLVEAGHASMPGGELQVRLGEYGLALGAGGQPSAAAGSVKYTAPELFRSAPPDARTDLFAAGFTAYEMFAGPRFGLVFAELIRDPRTAHLRWMQWHTGPGDVPALSAVRPEAPELAWIGPVVGRLIAKDPAARYASAGDALADLRARAQQAGGPAGASPLYSPPAVPAPTPGMPAPGSSGPGFPTPAFPAPSFQTGPVSGAAAPPPGAPLISSGAPLISSGGAPAGGPLISASGASSSAAAPSGNNLVPFTQVAPRMPGGGGVQSVTMPSPVSASGKQWGIVGTAPDGNGHPDGRETLLETAPPDTRPIWKKPAGIAIAAGLVLFAGLAVVALTRGNKVGELRTRAQAAWKAENWPESAKVHAELSAELKSRGGADSAEAALMSGIGELSDALAKENSDPPAAAEVARKLQPKLTELGAPKAVLARAADLARRVAPETEFVDEMKSAVAMFVKGELDAAGRHISKMGELNQKRALGRTAVMAAITRLRKDLKDVETHHQNLVKTTTLLEGGDLSVENRRALDEVVSGQSSVLLSLQQLSLPAELIALEKPADAARKSAELDREHAAKLLEFFNLRRAGDARLAKAKDELKTEVNKAAGIGSTGPAGKPQQGLDESRRNFERAADIAKSLADRGLGGVPPSTLAGVQSAIVFCKDAELFLTKYVRMIEKGPGVPKTPKVAALTVEQLTEYKGDLEKFRANGNLDQIIGADAVYASIIAEIDRRDLARDVAAREKKFGELDLAAKAAAAEGKFDEEIRLREEQARIKALPKDVETRVAELREAIKLAPDVEAQAKVLAEALAAVRKDLAETAKLVKVGPGQPGELAVDDLIKKLEDAKAAAAPTLSAAGALKVFRDEAVFRGKLAPAVADSTAADKLVVRIGELRGDLLRFNNFMIDADKAKPAERPVYWADAQKLVRGITGKTEPEGSTRELAAKLAGELEKQVAYARAGVEIDKKLINAENAMKACRTASSKEEQQKWLGTAKGALAEAERLTKELAFPLDEKRRERLDAVKKETNG